MHHFHRSRRKSKLLEWKRRLSAAEQTKDDSLAEERPDGERAELHITIVDTNADNPLLRQSCFSRVQSAEFLHPRDKAFVGPLRQVQRTGEHAVDSMTDDNASLAGIDVDIGRSRRDCAVDDESKKIVNGGRVTRNIRLRVVAYFDLS